MKISKGLLATLLVCVAACDDAGGDGDASAEGSSGAPAVDEQTPPTSGHVDIQAWLAEGHYESWTCESELHPFTVGVSPHGMQRICSNALMSAHGEGEYPPGASSVKELYGDDGVRYGYAVSLHVEAGAGGDSWYWYEQVSADHPAPHDERGVVADGRGDAGPAKSICVGCHMAAGTDADHPGHDMVYAQIR